MWKNKFSFLYFIVCLMLFSMNLKGDEFSEEEIKIILFDRLMKKTQVFAHHDRNKLETLFLSDPLNLGISRQGGEFGYSKPTLNDLHIKALETAVHKNALDIGTGHGYFIAKLLAAGTNHATGLEITNAHDQIANVVRLAQDLLEEDFSNKYSTIHNSFLKHSFKGRKKFDVISAFNVFHYFTPQEAKHGLSKVQKILAKNGRFFFIVNAPTNEGFKSFRAYKLKRESGALYPGYLTMLRQDLQEYYVDKKGQPTKLKRKISTTFIDSEPLKDKAKSQPGMFLQGDPALLPHKWQTGEATGIFTANIKETFFLWDKKTAEDMFAKAGLKILDIYYINSSLTRKDSLTDQDMENGAHFLAVEASHQDTISQSMDHDL